jgi:hypothetical protein
MAEGIIEPNVSQRTAFPFFKKHFARFENTLKWTNEKTGWCILSMDFAEFPTFDEMKKI